MTLRARHPLGPDCTPAAALDDPHLWLGKGLEVPPTCEDVPAHALTLGRWFGRLAEAAGGHPSPPMGERWTAALCRAQEHLGCGWAAPPPLPEAVVPLPPSLPALVAAAAALLILKTRPKP